MIDDLSIVKIIATQRRKHKKRRINKKWKKKYGFRYDLYHGDKLVERDVKIRVRPTSAYCYPRIGTNINMDFSSTNPLWKTDYCGG